MGGAASKIDNEEIVSMCRGRERFMKQAVASRHGLATAHIAYIHSLKNIGAAFRQFVESNIQAPVLSLPKTSSQPLPPPPPLFLLHPSPPGSTIHRSLSLPHHMLHNGSASPDNTGRPLSPQDGFPEEEDGQDGKEYLYGDAQAPPRTRLPAAAAPPPPPAPSSFTLSFEDFFPRTDSSLQLQEMRKSEQMLEEHNGTADYSLPDNELYQEEQAENGGYGSSPDNAIVKSEVVNEPIRLERRELALYPSLRTGEELVDVLRAVDDWFLAAYESGKEVGRMLEALKIHYHSNFMDPKDHPNHTNSSKRFGTISLRHWSSQSQRMTTPIKGMVEDIEGRGMAGSHASTLDQLYAWEKKLYEEVKGAETFRIEYEKQCSLLRRKNTRGVGNESINKTRAAIKSLQTRIAIALQAVDTATAAIQKLRDNELYPQLLEMLQKLTSMWKEMYDCHQRQRRIVLEMKILKELESADGTSKLHKQATSELKLSLTNWRNSFNRAISMQKEYLQSLNSWLRLSLLPLEIEFGDRLSSPVRNAPPPIYYLCIEWQQALDTFPDQVASEAISSFAAVIESIADLQSDEVRHRKKVEVLSKELQKKIAALQNHEKRHVDAISSPDEHINPVTAIVPYKSPYSAQKAVVDALQRKLEEETEKMKKTIQDARALTIKSFQTGLPSIFEAVTGFARVCCQTYQGLYTRVNGGQFPRLTDH